MSAFILAWVLVAFDGTHGRMTYSPALKTLEDCQRVQVFVMDSKWGRSQCVQVNILRGQNDSK